jgi:hypothetical protein
MFGNLTGFSNSLFDEFWRLQQEMIEVFFGDGAGPGTPGPRRGLPHGLARERGNLCRCGRLPVFAFAFVGSAGPVANTMDRRVAVGTAEGSSPRLSPAPTRR